MFRCAVYAQLQFQKYNMQKLNNNNYKYYEKTLLNYHRHSDGVWLQLG